MFGTRYVDLIISKGGFIEYVLCDAFGPPGFPRVIKFQVVPVEKQIIFTVLLLILRINI